MGIAASRIWHPLAEHCFARGIQFSCTPFYLEAVDELRPYVDFYKIASYELLVTRCWKPARAPAKPVVLSTGMATMDEIAAPRNVSKTAGARDVTLLHCVSAYPTPAGGSQSLRDRSHPRSDGLCRSAGPITRAGPR